jgi:hypothetical protein
MLSNGYQFIGEFMVGWLTTLSFLLVAYLASLEIAERRRNRTMNRKRHHFRFH